MFARPWSRRKEKRMLELMYIGEESKYNVEFSRISPHVVQVLGELPFMDSGFTLSRAGKNDAWPYPGFTTLYREVGGGLQISDDGSVYTAPPAPLPPEEPAPYVPTLEEMQETKVTEMNMIQENAIQAGVDVTLSDGTTEHFYLTQKDREELAVLQTAVARGDEKIPWHTSDETQHCKYYSNEDMSRIVTAAFDYAIYHKTYFRDLRIYIRSLETKEAVEAVTYGMEIPEKYRSQPLADMLASA